MMFCCFFNLLGYCLETILPDLLAIFVAFRIWRTFVNVSCEVDALEAHCDTQPRGVEPMCGWGNPLSCT